MNCTRIRRRVVLLTLARDIPLIHHRQMFLRTVNVTAIHTIDDRILHRLKSQRYRATLRTMRQIMRLSRHPLHPLMVIKIAHTCLADPIGQRPRLIRLAAMTDSIHLYNRHQITPHLCDVLLHKRTGNIMTREIRRIMSPRALMTDMSIAHSVSW